MEILSIDCSNLKVHCLGKNNTNDRYRHRCLSDLGKTRCARDVSESLTFVLPVKWLNYSTVHEGIIDKALSPGAADEELSRVFSFVLRCCDFWTPKGLEWINDQGKLIKILAIFDFSNCR